MGLFRWEIEDLLTELEARELLAPFFSHLDSCPVTAWDRWHAGVSESVLHDISSMQRGGCIHDLTIAEAKKTFTPAQNEGVELCQRLGIFKLYFTGTNDKLAVVRFRKLPVTGLLPPEQMSEQCQKWYWNEPLPGVRSSYTRLTCGYVLDAVELGIADVMIVLQVKDSIVWRFSIHEGAEGIRVPVQPLPSVLPPAAQISSIDPKTAKEGGSR